MLIKLLKNPLPPSHLRQLSSHYDAGQTFVTSWRYVTEYYLVAAQRAEGVVSSQTILQLWGDSLQRLPADHQNSHPQLSQVQKGKICRVINGADTERDRKYSFFLSISPTEHWSKAKTAHALCSKVLYCNVYIKSSLCGCSLYIFDTHSPYGTNIRSYKYVLCHPSFQPRQCWCMLSRLWGLLCSLVSFEGVEF